MKTVNLKDIALSLEDLDSITIQLGKLTKNPDRRRKFVYLYFDNIRIPIKDVKEMKLKCLKGMKTSNFSSGEDHTNANLEVMRVVQQNAAADAIADKIRKD